MSTLPKREEALFAEAESAFGTEIKFQPFCSVSEDGRVLFGRTVPPGLEPLRMVMITFALS